MTRAVHVPYTVEQDEDGVWCAHAQLRPGVGANGEGETPEAAIEDLREALIGLIAEFGGSAEVTEVACPGLADAVDAGDEDATAAAVAAAVAQTPANCEAVVLGCTEYELAGDRIRQALRRIPGGMDPLPVGAASGSIRVLLSGRLAGLPPAALLYPEGRLLAPLVVPTGVSEPVAGAVAGD